MLDIFKIFATLLTAEVTSVRCYSSKPEYVINRYVCLGCGTCFNECKYGAITETIHGFQINDSCTGCGKCADVCPINCIHKCSK